MKSQLFDKYQENQGHKSIYLSVLIPTYNRGESLENVLKSLSNQLDIDSSQFELIVIDDGSTDLTRTIVERFASENNIVTRYFFEQKKGPAAARNLGIKKAIGQVILFMGDDTLASDQLLHQHYDFHKNKSSEPHFALLGYCPMVQVHNLKPALIQSWLNRKQLAFQNLTHMQEISFNYFFTCNLSVNKTFLLQMGLFNEQYPFASGEDIELGSRLSTAGLKLHYNENAIAYHIHPMPLMGFIKRYFKMGRAAEIKRKIEIESKLNLTSSRNKLSPFKVNNPAKIAAYIFLYATSIAATLSGVVYEKVMRQR